MITRCKALRCDGAVEVLSGETSACPRCGQLHDGREYWNAIVYDLGRGYLRANSYSRSLILPKWKVGWKFGHQIAVPTRYNHTPAHTRKQRKRRIAKAKKTRWGGKHKTGRMPRA